MSLSLQAAFKAALKKRGLLTSLGFSKYAVVNLKRNHKAGKVSVEMMRKVVTKAGYICISEEQWSGNSKYPLAH